MVHEMMPEPTLTGPPTMWAYDCDRAQLSAERMALRSAPPGIELTIAIAVDNLGR